MRGAWSRLRECFEPRSRDRRILPLCSGPVLMVFASTASCMLLGGEAFAAPEPAKQPRFAAYHYELFNTLRLDSGELGQVLIRTLKDSRRFSNLEFGRQCARCIKIVLERLPDNSYVSDRFVEQPRYSTVTAVTRLAFLRTFCIFPSFHYEERTVTFEIREKGVTRRRFTYTMDQWVARSIMLLPFESRRHVSLDALARVVHQFLDDAERAGSLAPLETTEADR